MKSCGHSLIGERLGTPEEASGQIRLAVPISRAEAAPFILQYHYSKTVPTGKNIFFGCYVGSTLFAVADYGLIASRSEPSVVLGRYDATRDNTLELRRLCRRGKKGEPGPVQMSDFLRACHENLALTYQYILSYSDQQFNKFEVQFKRAKHKSGGIYKHAGFTWVGETATEWHVIDREGHRFHRSRAYRKMLSHNLALCTRLGIPVPQKLTGNKDRIWPQGPGLWAFEDAMFPLSPNKLWELEQVRAAMGFTRVECPPKDKWLLTL